MQPRERGGFLGCFVLGCFFLVWIKTTNYTSQIKYKLRLSSSLALSGIIDTEKKEDETRKQWISTLERKDTCRILAKIYSLSIKLA